QGARLLLPGGRLRARTGAVPRRPRRPRVLVGRLRPGGQPRARAPVRLGGPVRVRDRPPPDRPPAERDLAQPDAGLPPAGHRPDPHRLPDGGAGVGPGTGLQPLRAAPRPGARPRRRGQGRAGPLQLPDRRHRPDVRPDGHPGRHRHQPGGDAPRLRGGLLRRARRRVRRDRRFLPPAQTARMRGHPVTTTRHDELRAPGATRTRLWDRVKILLGLAAIHLLLTWKVTAEYAGVMPFADGARTVSGEHPWIFWLVGAAAAPQAPLLMSERWAAYRRFWGGVSGRADPRLARVVKIALLVGLLAVVLAAMLGTSPPQALFHVPAMLFGPLPFAVQAVLLSLLVMALVAGLALILSRGG